MVDDLDTTPKGPAKWMRTCVFPNHLTGQLTGNVGQVSSGQGRVERMNPLLEGIDRFSTRTVEATRFHRSIFGSLRWRVIRQSPERTHKFPSPHGDRSGKSLSGK